jgi:hypothetical protein
MAALAAFTIPNEPADQEFSAMQQAPDGSFWFIAGYGSLLKYANEPGKSWNTWTRSLTIWRCKAMRSGWPRVTG